MSKADLSDAIASVDWADRQITVLSAEIAEFAATNPYTITREVNPQGWAVFYMATDKPIAKLFSGSVNAIIQAQRSSLDYIAVALAESNGSRNPTDTYFPIVKTEDGLSDKRTLKKIRALNAADQQVILDLKPYAGGNDTLFALHSLNTERKHRRLGILATTPTLERVGGNMRLFEMRTFEPTILGKDRHPIFAARFDGEIKLNFAVQIAFCEVPGKQASPPVIQTLREFSAACRDIAALFS